jgi:CHAT domain-containing protein
VAYAGQGQYFLPNALPEAQSVGAHFPQVVELFEENALPERVIEAANEQPYEVLHLSCHGRFDFDSPTDSGLLLAQDRMLSLNDIRIRMRLQGRPLVTLSACQTGQTRPEQGDETTGLSWAFLAAGASAVVSSQWSVPDASTRLLFEAFYLLRRQTNMSDAEALRQAIQLVRKKAAYRKLPQFWAAFQVMGLPLAD